MKCEGLRPSSAELVTRLAGPEKHADAAATSIEAIARTLWFGHHPQSRDLSPAAHRLG